MNTTATNRTCPACLESVEPVLVESLAHYTLYGCPECTVTFSDPMSAGSGEWYESVYNKTDLRPSMYRQVSWEFTEFSNNLSRRRGKLLDVGCGEGFFLEHVKSQGYDPVGIDMNEQAVNKATQKGLTAYCMDLEQYLKHFPGSTFDVISFFHVLEHLEQPNKFISTVSKILTDGGDIVFSVPNPDRLGLIFGKEAWDYPPHHLTSWNRQSLETLMKINYFEVAIFKDEPLIFMKEMPEYMSGEIRFGINEKVESIHSRVKNNAAKTTLQLLYKNLSKCKKLFSQLLTFIALPWYFFRYRNKKGRSLLVITRKLPVTGEYERKDL